MQPTAVAIVHGIEIEDPSFAETPTKLLTEAFTAAAGPDGPDPEAALVVEPIHWAPDLQQRQQELFDRVFETDSGEFFETTIAETITEINAGSTWHLVPLLASMAGQTSGNLTRLHWPTARWLMIHFIGDVIAYDRSGDRANYNAIHTTFANGLANLADRAGPDAPLCVLAHSFGTVLANDYFYDQQHPRRTQVAEAVNQARGDSPLARGHTLSWLYTMGSPLALWSLRYQKSTRKMSKPIAFPGRRVAKNFPDLATEWVNFYDKDDIIAYPLRGLSDHYAATVTEDRAVDVREFPVSQTPLTHPFYWTDRTVMDQIGAALATGWQHINQHQT